MIGNGMGWEMTRAGAVQAQIAKIRESNTDGEMVAVIVANGNDLAIVTNASADFIVNQEHFVFI